MSFGVLRRLCDDAYRAQDAGMSVGLPRVHVDASQLKHLLDRFDHEQAETARLKAERNALREVLREVQVMVPYASPAYDVIYDALGGGE